MVSITVNDLVIMANVALAALCVENLENYGQLRFHTYV